MHVKNEGLTLAEGFTCALSQQESGYGTHLQGKDQSSGSLFCTISEQALIFSCTAKSPVELQGKGIIKIFPYTFNSVALEYPRFLGTYAEIPVPDWV